MSPRVPKRKKAKDLYPLVILSGRHKPFEIIILLVAFAIGLTEIVIDVSTTSTTSIIHDLTPHLYLVWNFGIPIGSGVAIIGCYWRTLTDSLLIERIGLIILGTLTFSYGIGILLIPTANKGSTFFLLAIGAACLVRVGQITFELGKIKRALAPPPPSQPIVSDDSSTPLIRTDPQLPKIHRQEDNDDKESP